MDLNSATIVLILGVGVLTAAAAVWDIRFRRIPNWLTLPMFGAGLLFQIAVSLLYGWQHFTSAAGGFLVGFGILFVLWLVGGGGGGDVKLMGALSVWLGFRLTLMVMIVSTFLVLFGTVGAVAWSIAARGWQRTRQRFLAPPQGRQEGAPRPETVHSRQHRRIMAYATPIALATWLVVLWKLPSLDRGWDVRNVSAAAVPAAPK